MSRRLFIISKSHLDIRLTAAAFVHQLNYNVIKVLVFGNPATLEALREAGIPEASIVRIPFSSDSLRLRRLGSYLQALYREKCLIDRLIKEIQKEAGSEVLFFSYHMSPHVGYFLHKISRTNKIMFLDAIAEVPNPLSLWQRPTLPIISMAAYWTAISVVFGKIFGVSGTPTYPTVYVKPSKCRVSACTESIRTSLTGARNALFRCSAGGSRNAVILYSDPFLCDPELWRQTYEMVFEVLLQEGFRILVKVHPTSSFPSFLDATRIIFLPQHLPFELIDFQELSLIVGVDGGAMVDKLNIPTISLKKMLYPEGSDELERSLIFLRKKAMTVMFAESEEHFRNIVSRKRLPN